ncbi:hypothetical protein PF007_g23574 [Phytophthora fragariae]|uniref:Uncharacterized protein n=1 Tax=Phytophthora fragariae TaxID=53985 RepID=A0A6A3QNX7_9STRA|nr:hypothetical protein PF007_g23574 [Phytophthora fragariae]
MSSDRREQAEQRLLDVERENQRLQAAASMKTIRGDAYKASFDRNVEQRTQDNVKPSEVVATLESQVEEQNQRLQLVVDRQTADHGILSFRADESEGRVAELTKVLCQLPNAWTFASDDADFVSLIRVFSFHLKKWCQVYWECTHTFPLGEHPLAFLLELQEDRSTHKSRSKFNFDQTLLPAVIRLMRHGRNDIDVLLDPIFTPSPPTRHRTRWYPTGTVDTLADGSPDPDLLYRALQRVDRAEPWRLYFRNAPADHPARSLDRLKDKFVPVVE